MKPLLIPALFLSLCSAASAADWPMFRGADRTDISTETGLLKQWPESGPKKAWTSDKAGIGYSSFAIVDGMLYTEGAHDGKAFVIAFDAGTGEKKWETEMGDMFHNNQGDGPRSTPAVDGGRVYALSGPGDIVCLDAKKGEVVWKTSMTEYGGRPPGWGYSESPLVDGDKLICTPGGGQGTLLALNKNDGKKIWQSADWTEKAQYASPIVEEHNGKRQYIQLTMHDFAGVDAADGKVLWKVPFPGKTAVVPTPIFRDGQVYVAAGYGVGCEAVKLTGSANPDIVYDHNLTMVNHHGGVILVGDYLYGYSDKGGWTCQDWKTGEPKWQEKGKLGKGAVHCADGMLYLLEEKTGTVVLIDASPNGWNEHGRFKLEPQSLNRNSKGTVWTHPVISGGKLYLRDQELLFCYDVKA